MTNEEITRWLDRRRPQPAGLTVDEWEAKVDPPGPDGAIVERLWPRERRCGIAYWHTIGRNRYRIHVAAPTLEGAVILAQAKEQTLNVEHQPVSKKEN